jgi:hypothetical protein
LDEAKGF